MGRIFTELEITGNEYIDIFTGKQFGNLYIDSFFFFSLENMDSFFDPLTDFVDLDASDRDGHVGEGALQVSHAKHTADAR